MEVEFEAGDWQGQLALASQQGNVAARHAWSSVEAVREMIGDNAPPASYFAAALASLKKLPDSKENVEQCTGLLLLVKSVYPSLSGAAVLTQGVQLLDRLSQVLFFYKDDEECCKAVLEIFLLVTTTIATGKHMFTKHYRAKIMLLLMTDPRPAVRKMVHKVVAHSLEAYAQRISSGQESEENVNNMTAYLTSFCNFIIQSLKSPMAVKGGDSSPAIYLAQFLKGNLQFFNLQQRVILLKALLPFCGRAGQSTVAVHIFNVLCAFGERPEILNFKDEGDEIATCLSALQSLKVQDQDPRYVSAYLKALSSLSAAPSMSGHISKSLMAVQPLLLEAAGVQFHACKDACKKMFEASAHKNILGLADCILFCKSLLDYRFKGRWRNILKNIVGEFFRVCATVRSQQKVEEMEKFSDLLWQDCKLLFVELVNIAEGSTGSDINTFGDQLESCTGAAVEVFGPERILTLTPFRFDIPMSEKLWERKSRSWLLPVLAKYTKRTTLSSFAKVCLPVASQLLKHSEIKDQPTLAKKYGLLLEHVWTLLPGFCMEPVDAPAALSTNKGFLIRTVIGVIQTKPALRPMVCSALALLCENSFKPDTEIMKATSEANKKCLATFGHRVLKELLDTYLKFQIQGDRKAAEEILEVITTYAQVCQSDAVSFTFKTSVQRMLQLNSQGEEIARQHLHELLGLVELAAAFVPLVPASMLDQALATFAPMLSGGIAALGRQALHQVQKMAYRAVRCLCEHEDAVAADKLGNAEIFLKFWNVLCDTQATWEGAAMKQRVMALRAIMAVWQEVPALQAQTPALAKQIFPKLVPELMLKVREVSGGVRRIAWECLSTIAGLAKTGDTQNLIFTLLATGLAGTSRYMKSAAVETLGKVLYEQRETVEKDLRDRCIKTLLILIEDDDRVVFKAVLRFSKIVVTLLTPEELEQVTPIIFKGFKSKHCNSVKSVLRRILEKLVKKLGPKTVGDMMPEEHIALYNHVLRMDRRWNRPDVSDSDESSDESDSESDGEEAMIGKRKLDQVMDDEDEKENRGIKKLTLPGPKDTDKREASSKKRTAQDAGLSNEDLAARKAKENAKENIIKKMLDAWEAESDSDDEEFVSRKPISRKSAKRDVNVDDESTYILEGDDELDFLDNQAAQKVLTANPNKKARRKSHLSVAERLKEAGINFSDNGRLNIIEENEDKNKNKKGKKDELPKQKMSLSQLKKMKGRKQMKRLAKKGHNITGLDQFKPKKKSSGDAKRHSALEPFAYMRLNPKLTHEKNKIKAMASLGEVVTKKNKRKGKKSTQIRKHSAELYLEAVRSYCAEECDMLGKTVGSSPTHEEQGGNSSSKMNFYDFYDGHETCSQMIGKRKLDQVMDEKECLTFTRGVVLKGGEELLHGGVLYDGENFWVVADAYGRQAENESTYGETDYASVGSFCTEDCFMGLSALQHSNEPIVVNT
eukprot:gene443-895_t